MSIQAEIIGTDQDAHKVEASMHHGIDTPPGVVVYTEPLRFFNPEIVPFLNPVVGSDMNQDAAFGGTPDIVHTGITDGVHWTGSNIVGGKANFNSGDRAFAGVVSDKIDNPALNDVWQYDKGSDLVVTNYVAITAFINIDKDWTAGDSVALYCYDTGTAVQIGAQVLIENYIDENNFDVWQSMVIPFLDLGLSTTNFDAIRMQLVAKGGGKAPKFYLDNIQVEQTGTPFEFRISIPNNTLYRINRLRITMAAPLDTTLADGTMASLSFDKLLALTSLPNGIILKAVQFGITTFSLSINQLSDLMMIGFNMQNQICDGVNTMLTVEQEFPEPIQIAGGVDNYLSLTISDDLSSFLLLRAFTRGAVEIKEE